MEQGMFIRSKDISNPVLLFLHGGPGMPEYFLEDKYPSGLDQYFTVCWWEQRGAGLSYPNPQDKVITTEQLIEDSIAVTNYLRGRFQQDQIYLMGHSWGTFLGIQTVKQKPELYRAYIGVSQISQQLESEKLAYAYMLEQYSLAGNTGMVNKLKEYTANEADHAMQAYLSSSLRDKAMHELGVGTMRNMNSVVKGIFWPVMRCKAYTLEEKIKIWRGKASLKNSSELYNQLYATDLSAEITQLDVPVYFFSGKYDYTVSFQLTKEFYSRLQAKRKGFYTFEQSAHSPLFEERERFLDIMKDDVLNLTVNLADR
jgi:pimeloyl-ACP methyl ester carboxylesterase